MWTCIVIASLLGLSVGFCLYRLWRRRRFTHFGFEVGDTITILSNTGSETRKIKGISRKVLTLDEDEEGGRYVEMDVDT